MTRCAHLMLRMTKEIYGNRAILSRNEEMWIGEVQLLRGLGGDVLTLTIIAQLSPAHQPPCPAGLVPGLGERGSVGVWECGRSVGE